MHPSQLLATNPQIQLVQSLDSPTIDASTTVTSESEAASSDLYDADYSSHSADYDWAQGKLRSERSESPAPSVYSFHESLDGYLLRDHHGRACNSKNVSYPLPADVEEHERLNIQHAMLRKCLGAPYPEKEAVEELLKPRTGYSPRVLDIGTGSGIWAIEMSKRFPHAEVIGVDLAPPSLQMSNIPDNCRFEIDDGNLSFTHWTNSFDLVHGRSVNVGIHDFSQFLYNMAQILKPGGMLIMAGGMHQFYDETAKPYPNAIEGQRGFSALQRWFTIVRNGYKRITAPVSEQPVDIFDLPFSWDQWASSNGNFEDVNTLTVKIPVGDWHPGLSSEMAQAGELCRSDLLMLIESWAPTVISSGESPLLVEYWRAEAIKEVRERRLRSYAEWRWLWGRRADCDWIPSSTELGSSSAESKG